MARINLSGRDKILFLINALRKICSIAKAVKDLKKVPLPIDIKLQAWIDLIGHRRLSESRKISGYHDEPLKGKEKDIGLFV